MGRGGSGAERIAEPRVEDKTPSTPYFRVRLPHVHNTTSTVLKAGVSSRRRVGLGQGDCRQFRRNPGCTVGLPHGGPRDLLEACTPDAEPGEQPWSKRDSRKNPSRFIPCLSFPFSKASSWGCNSNFGQQGADGAVNQSVGFLSSGSFGGFVVSSLTT